MKLTKLFIAIFFISSLFSCSSDDDNQESISDSENILGSWTLTRVMFDGETTYNGFPVTIEGEGLNYNGILTFTDNPNEYTADTSYDATVEVKSNGISLFEETYENLDSFGQEGTWSIDGNEMTITQTESGEAETANFAFSNGDDTLTFETTRPFENNGISVDINVELVYTR